MSSLYQFKTDASKKKKPKLTVQLNNIKELGTSYNISKNLGHNIIEKTSIYNLDIKTDDQIWALQKKLHVIGDVWHINGYMFTLNIEKENQQIMLVL